MDMMFFKFSKILCNFIYSIEPFTRNNENNIDQLINKLIKLVKIMHQNIVIVHHHCPAAYVYQFIPFTDNMQLSLC